MHSLGAVVWPVVFPDALQTIRAYAFDGCSSLASVAFPDALQTIGEYAFFECSSLSSVAFPGALPTIRAWAFSRECAGEFKLPYFRQAIFYT